MPTPSIKETISAHDEGEDLPRMGGAPQADHPAVFTMHCHSGPTNACVKHARSIETLYQRMWSIRVQATKAPEGSQCDNCVNEAATTTTEARATGIHPTAQTMIDDMNGGIEG